MDLSKVVVKVREREVLLQEDIKELNPGLVIMIKLVLKEVRCLCKDVFRNSVLKMLIV